MGLDGFLDGIFVKNFIESSKELIGNGERKNTVCVRERKGVESCVVEQLLMLEYYVERRKLSLL